MDLVSRVGKHIYQRNGVITELKSMGTRHLGYGIRKLDGRYYEGQLFQMTMMAPPSMNKELHYLNKEDRLLRWLMVKHRDLKMGLDYMQEDTGKMELSKFRSRLFDNEDKDMDFDDDEDDDDDEEYNVDGIQLDD